MLKVRTFRQLNPLLVNFNCFKIYIKRLYIFNQQVSLGRSFNTDCPGDVHTNKAIILMSHNNIDKYEVPIN